MIILEENFKWHLEAFASELFIYCIPEAPTYILDTPISLMPAVIIGTQLNVAVLNFKSA